MTDEYQDGRSAYLDGKRSDFNPHKKDTRHYNDWRKGWIEEALKEIEVARQR